MTSGSRKKQRNITRYVIASTAFFLTAIVFLCFLVPFTAVFFPGLFMKDTGALSLNAGAGGNTNLFYILKTTLFTLKIAAGSTLVAVFIGFPAAFFCAKRKFLFKKVLLGLSAVPLCIPILIAALGFVSVFGLSGFMNKVIVSFTAGEKSRILYSQWGIMVAQGFYNFPLVMSMVSRFWESLPEENQNAARLLGSNERQVFFKITLPSLVPAIVSSVIPVFLFCYFSFMMVLLFSAPGTSTLEVEIYQAVKTSLDIKAASRLAIAETLSAIIIVALYTVFVRNQMQSGEVFHKNKKPSVACADYETGVSKVLEILLFVFILILILLFFVAPLAGIVFSGFTARIGGKDVLSLNQYRTLFKSKGFWESLKTTIYVSLYTGTLCTFVSLVYALLIHKVKSVFKKRILEITALLPMAVSSVVLGFGMTLVFKKGNVFSLVIVQTALFWPLAYRQINSALMKIPSDVMNAASMLSDNYLDGVFRVIVPWLKKPLFASFGFCFAFSAGDTTLPLILAIPKFQTLSLYTYRLSGSYRFNTACASGTILALICFAVFALSEKIGGKK